MSALGTAIAVEARKLVASRMLPWTTGILLGGLAALTSGLLAAARTGDVRILAKLGPLARATGWELLVGTAAQVLAAGGFGACGILLAWIFGREFADGTVAGLFALPVRRSIVALGKLVVYLAWAVSVAAALTALLAAIGAAAGLFAADPAGLGELVRIPVLTLLTALLAVPAGWVASLGRSVLAGIAATIVLIVVAQVCAVLGVGAWFPLVAPALWAIDPATVPLAALLGVPVVAVVLGGATTFVWARLQLDR